MSFPFVSVIIVSLNGAHYLPGCLDALRLQTYPADSFEVIVSDNGSQDSTEKLLGEQYPWVQLLKNVRNLGFSGGNNAALPLARGEYIILLNNDTAPEETWLEEMVAAAESSPQAGLVSGHLQLFYDQLVLRLEADTFKPVGDNRHLGVMFFSVDCGAERSITQYLDGFYGRESYPGGRAFRWMRDRALLGAPVPKGQGDWVLKFELSAGGRPDQQPAALKIYLGDQPIANWMISVGEPQWYTAVIPGAARRLASRLEQNTGVLVQRSGSGRDRGTYVRGDELFFELDQGQYHQLEEVFAGCGASLLLRRKMLEQTGAFDDDLFMYYEDVDLSWRARLFGWSVVFAPQARCRHIHCGTTQEWSPFFLYLTERNRLAMVFKNGSWRHVMQVWGGFFQKTANTAWKMFRKAVIGRPEWRSFAGELRVQMHVLGTLLAWQPGLWVKRIKIHKAAVVAPLSLESWFKEDDHARGDI